MDERAFLYKVGEPIPSWDLRHRLPIDKPVSMQSRDDGTIFRINTTFMDVTDQPYMTRQMQAGGVLVAFGFSVSMSFLLVYVLLRTPAVITGGLIFMWATILTGIIGFGIVAVKFGRDEFFALTRRPIRFNRKEQKIYTIRRRRFFAKAGEGDVTWEVPWNAQSIFCVHSSHRSIETTYHIRHYTTDADGNVLTAFAIGREWVGKENLQGLLAQWNFWCEYMNHGPANLPSPPLFFSERESAKESFLFCLYGEGASASLIYRLLSMPFILLFTSHRLMALWTCRDPVWPKSVIAVSGIDPGDAFDQPSGDTPIGWGPTALKRAIGKWPRDPKKAIPQWQGEQDSMKNAMMWAGNSAPQVP